MGILDKIREALRPPTDATDATDAPDASATRRLGEDLSWLRDRVVDLGAAVDLLKSKTEISSADWYRLQELRRRRELPEDPLVSVCISTHDRSDLLLSRALPSVLGQTYRNLEVIVVADGCQDGTEDRVARIEDARIHLESIERDFPDLDDSRRRWMVSGSMPNNVALSLAKGDFITHLDDDDEYLPDRIEKLVSLARTADLDLVYHPFLAETPDGEWFEIEANGLRLAQVTTSSILYRRWLKHVLWDPDTHLLGEPADWNRIRRMIYTGASYGRHPDRLVMHFRERNQAATRSPPTQEGVPSLDVRGPGSRGLIHVVGKYDFGLRHDWHEAMVALERAYGHGKTAMVSGIDWLMMSGDEFPDDWIGVFHQPLSSFPPCIGLVDLKAELERRGARESCQGIFVLTDFQKRYLEGVDLGVPLHRLWLPTELDVPQWSPKRWRADPSVVFVGRWIRRLQAIQELDCPGVRKSWLTKQEGSVEGVRENGTVTRCDFQSTEAYDELLAGSVVMTEVIEAAANNVVVECIARSTPLLINWNSSAVEYLGAHYPLYYGSMAEASWKAGDERQIMAAHRYLVGLDKSKLRVDRFVKDFGESEIVRRLARRVEAR